VSSGLTAVLSIYIASVSKRIMNAILSVTSGFLIIAIMVFLDLYGVNFYAIIAGFVWLIDSHVQRVS